MKLFSKGQYHEDDFGFDYDNEPEPEPEPPKPQYETRHVNVRRLTVSIEGGKDWNWDFEMDAPDEEINAVLRQFDHHGWNTRLIDIRTGMPFPLKLNYQKIISVSVAKTTVRRRFNVGG